MRRREEVKCLCWMAHFNAGSQFYVFGSIFHKNRHDSRKHNIIRNLKLGLFLMIHACVRNFEISRICVVVHAWVWWKLMSLEMFSIYPRIIIFVESNNCTPSVCFYISKCHKELNKSEILRISSLNASYKRVFLSGLTKYRFTKEVIISAVPSEGHSGGFFFQNAVTQQI